MARDGVTLCLSGGDVQVFLGLGQLSAWLGMSQDETRVMLLSTFGAAALGGKAGDIAAAAAVPAAARSGDDEEIIRELKARAARG